MSKICESLKVETLEYHLATLSARISPSRSPRISAVVISRFSFLVTKYHRGNADELKPPVAPMLIELDVGPWIKAASAISPFLKKKI